MEQTTLLKDYPLEEKGAYFGALASLASADGKTTEEELEFLALMGEAADLPENVQQEVEMIAKNPSQINVQQCLDVLKRSQLRFSFVTDIISFAKADGHYAQEEQKEIQQMADYLGVNQKQYSILEQYVNKADEAQQQGEDPTSQSFLNKNGFGDMFKNAGISPQMVQGVLGVVAPLVIAKLLRGGRRRRYRGGIGGGLLGGLLGGGMYRSGGGLGSIISILGGLNGRKGYGNMRRSGGLGSLLGGILGGRRGGSGW
ncbi:tellurite resistance protein TerB [Pontibacter ummariensis]|uniref:Tellurite resistance protein TerB n=1 Tax=Pontibacter ummariensis TaxID=1610492 RepID=A0A239KUM1_9BACT|nr:TerB family tellurite resistance protein [Pontibacter ummariensis]PRY04967.1 tellurite resistance protein TerB [Pontibacter ummariensis]SNT21911.1 Tellurite resistance protein TerB [Pontibacter ummariensis]